MIQILVYGMNPNIGGVEEYLMNLYRRVHTKQIQFNFVVEGKSCIYEEEIKQLGGSVHYIIPRKESMFQNIKQHYKLLKTYKHQIDMVYLNLSVLYYNVVFYLLVLLGYKHLVVHAHNTRSAQMNRVYEVLHKLNRGIVNRKAEVKWACSIDAGKWLFGEKAAQSHEVQIIHNAVDCMGFKHDLEKRQQLRKVMHLENQMVIGHVGRMSYQKNQEFLLETFRYIKKQIPQAVLLLVGDGELRQAREQQAKQLGIEESVIFLGERRDVADLMQVMDAFVLTSRFEGFCIVLVEAQAAGLKTFASKEANPESIRLTSLLEFISLQEKPEEWANKICKSISVYEKKDMTEEIRKSGFDLEQTTNQFEIFVKKLCNEV